MSAQGSPNPSSAHPPHREHPSAGANPLRRTSDRIESWVFRCLMVVLLLGMPAASLDREGAVTDPPMSADNATAGGWLAGGLAALAVATGVCAARAGVRKVLDRGRYARWDAEWDLVEPQWSARFRR